MIVYPSFSENKPGTISRITIEGPISSFSLVTDERKVWEHVYAHRIDSKYAFACTFFLSSFLGRFLSSSYSFVFRRSSLFFLSLSFQELNIGRCPPVRMTLLLVAPHLWRLWSKKTDWVWQADFATGKSERDETRRGIVQPWYPALIEK